MSLAIVVPLRDFSLAKVRLRTHGLDNVTTLARTLATNVLGACSPRATYVVTESSDVARFARALGVAVLRSPEPSLNGAVSHAYASLATNHDQLMVVHGDLKYPAGLGTFEPASGVTIVTDDLADGTNVLVIPTGHDFHFQYGPTSKAHHVSEATRLGLAVTLIENSPWRFDVDEPGDL